MTDFLSQLPTELLRQVIGYFAADHDAESLESLALTSKLLHQIVCPIIFRHITVELGALRRAVSNGYRQRTFTNISAMTKAVIGRYSQHYRKIDIIALDYDVECEELLRYLLSLEAANHIDISVNENTTLCACEFLSHVTPSAQVDVKLKPSFKQMDELKRLEQVLGDYLGNINFIIHGYPTVGQQLANIPSLPYIMAHMTSIFFFLLRDCNASELNDFFDNHELDNLTTVQFRGGLIFNVVKPDISRLILPDHVTSLLLQCSFMFNSNRMTIEGKSLRKLLCRGPLPETVRISGPIKDLMLILDDKSRARLMPENYGITNSTEKISVIAREVSALCIKEIIRAAPSKLSISYQQLRWDDMKQMLLSQTTQSQVTELTISTPFCKPDKSIFEFLAAFTAKMPRLTKLTAPYSDALSDFVEPIATTGRESRQCVVDLDFLKAVRASLDTF
ncbi:hypothetical protein TRVA0_010S00760 [Trichomonascus vanleenenianus]|uniref:uncharacterized protein n=1 Tax=Trichomonascus vanleenenianus TaxID=2268995 RepID=UPI003ECADE76